MKGTIKTERVVLDYTGVAEPIIIGDIKADVDALYEEDRPNPDLIRLWRHQFDYLVTACRAEYGSVADCLESGDRIWGIPLEVKERPAPCRIELKFDFPRFEFTAPYGR